MIHRLIHKPRSFLISQDQSPKLSRSNIGNPEAFKDLKRILVGRWIGGGESAAVNWHARLCITIGRVTNDKDSLRNSMSTKGQLWRNWALYEGGKRKEGRPGTAFQSHQVQVYTRRPLPHASHAFSVSTEEKSERPAADWRSILASTTPLATRLLVAGLSGGGGVG